MLSSIANLEEFLQEKYVERYNAGDEGIKPLEYLLNDRNCSKYFQKSKKGEYAFIDSSSGMKYYFINKSGLPEDVQKNLKGGDAVLSNNYWASFVDVYGVTSDLKVYYCSDGKTSWMGAADEEIYTDMNTGISGMGAGSSWSTALGLDREATLRDTMSKEVLTITDSDLDLNLMYNMPNLKEITFDGITRDDLDGLDNAISLQKITFNNCNLKSLNGINNATLVTEVKFTDSRIENYNALCNLTKLAKLYLVRPVGLNDEVADFCSSNKGIRDAQFEYLKYFGIVGDDTYLNVNTSDSGKYSCSAKKMSNITNISGLAELNSKTRSAIEYMNLQNLRITSLKSIEEYTSIMALRCENNSIRTFEGIQKMNQLAYIIAQNQYELDSDENKVATLGVDEQETKNSLKDALSYIFFDENTEKNTTLYYLDVGSAAVKWTSYLADCSNLHYLYLNGVFTIKDSSTLGGVIATCGTNGVIEPEFAKELLNPSMPTVDLNGQTISFTTLETLIPVDSESGEKEVNENLLNLRLELCSFLDADNNSLSGTTLNSRLNTFLSYFPNLQVLCLKDIEDLTSIEFVKSCTLIQGIDLRGTSVITHNGDETQNGLELLNSLTIGLLFLDNPNINLTDINETIVGVIEGRKAFSPFQGWSGIGLYLKNETLFGKLPQCTGFTGPFYLNANDYSITWDLSSENITQIYLPSFPKVNFTLPSTVTSIIFQNDNQAKLDISRLGDFSFEPGGMGLSNVRKNILNTYNGTSEITVLSIRCYAFNSYTDISWFNQTFNGHYLKVKKLNINTYQEHNYTVTSLNGIQSLRNLQILNIPHYFRKLSDVSKLNMCPELTSITIKNAEIENFPDLSPVYDKENPTKLISGCPNLTDLYLSHNSLNPTSIANISKITTLKKLSIDYNSLTDIYLLKNLVNLQELNVAGNLLEEYCYNSDNERYNVCELLANMNYKRTGKTAENGFSILWLSGNKIEDSTDNDDEFAPLKASDVKWTQKSGF